MITTHTIDVVIIIAYFLFITGLGIFFGKFTKSTKDFFFGGQRFSWWMIAMSCVATVVGSYSFIKYSTAGYKFGLSSTMTYLNDWFIVPFFLLGWLPIIYFNRIVSIPEYFEKRFDKKTKIAAITIILIYMIGYVGINYYTLGVALQPILKMNLYVIILIVAILGAAYMHAGGQTSVIMTDIVQGFILITAGVIIFFLSSDYLGLDKFWSGLPQSHKLPFSGFNEPSTFPAVGIFWQDAAASSIAFWFMSQGTIMRFLSAKSPREGRKAMFAIILVLMPLAAFALSNAGWFGKAMVTHGIIPEDTNPNHIFVTVASKVAKPGIFGFVLAALTAALMSTIDTLINAISAITVNDIYRPYMRPGKDDKHYLRAAQIVALISAAVGMALVPLFASFKSIYSAHGIFIATVTPAMVLVIMLSVFWKRLTSTAAFYTLVGGSVMMGLAATWPQDIIAPFAHGINPENNFKFIRAFFGLVCSGLLAVILTYFTKVKSDQQLNGLVVDSLHEAKKFFKGAEPNDDEYAKPIELQLNAGQADMAHMHADDMQRLLVNEGDLVYVADARWYTGGLRSTQIKLGPAHEKPGIITLPEAMIIDAQLLEKYNVKVEKII